MSIDTNAARKYEGPDEHGADKRGEYERRARECLQSLHGLMAEAKREGYHVEIYSSLDMGGEPKSRIAVIAR